MTGQFTRVIESFFFFSVPLTMIMKYAEEKKSGPLETRSVQNVTFFKSTVVLLVVGFSFYRTAHCQRLNTACFN